MSDEATIPQIKAESPHGSQIRLSKSKLAASRTTFMSKPNFMLSKASLLGSRNLLGGSKVNIKASSLALNRIGSNRMLKEKRESIVIPKPALTYENNYRLTPTIRYIILVIFGLEMKMSQK